MRSLIVFILFFFSGEMICQDLAREPDQVYGQDPLLYNGKKYAYFLPRGTGGDQFLRSTDYFTGEVTIKGISFEGISLNYDIFNQQLLLQYDSESGASEIIEISKAWLESFQLDEMKFIYLGFNSEPRIYQVIGDGPLYILYYWRKDLNLDNTKGGGIYTFSSPKKSKYVLIDGKISTFSSKGSFISLFDPVHKLVIRNYIHDNGIKLKKASDQTMTELINYIGNL